MAQYSIGDVENLTGIKPHVLRYWEEIIPALSPRKNIGGRRTYSSRDVQIIMRLKYLIQEKKFTIEGARNTLIEEAGKIAAAPDELPGKLIQQINELRGELADLYYSIHKIKEGKN